jgi:hypothetical protein
MVPYRFPSATGDSLATTWDPGALRPGINFEYLQTAGTFLNQGDGGTSPVDTSGAPYSQLAGAPLAALARIAISGQSLPSILFTYSQNPNTVSVLYGGLPISFAVQTPPVTVPADGILLPYAGDANGDGQDEIGLRTISPSKTLGTQHLLLLSSKKSTIDPTAPIQDISSTTENYRGMALGFLAVGTDRRFVAHRKDLIALAENPGTLTSRLVVRRANLNYVFP